MRRFKGKEESATPNSDNPSKAQQPKATATATAPQTREDTPWPNAMPASTNLFSQKHHGQFPQVKPQHPCSLKQKRQKTGPHQR